MKAKGSLGCSIFSGSAAVFFFLFAPEPINLIGIINLFPCFLNAAIFYFLNQPTAEEKEQLAKEEAYWKYQEDLWEGTE